MQQQFQRLQQVVQAAATVAELVRDKQTYRYGVRAATTLYLHAQYAEVRIQRWEIPAIEIAAEIQAGFGWRIAQEQDDAGVYFVAKRRRFIGSLSGAIFTLTLPRDAHAILRLEHCQLWSPDISGEIELPGNTVPKVRALPQEV